MKWFEVLSCQLFWSLQWTIQPNSVLLAHAHSTVISRSELQAQTVAGMPYRHCPERLLRSTTTEMSGGSKWKTQMQRNTNLVPDFVTCSSRTFNCTVSSQINHCALVVVVLPLRDLKYLIRRNTFTIILSKKFNLSKYFAFVIPPDDFSVFWGYCAGHSISWLS